MRLRCWLAVLATACSSALAAGCIESPPTPPGPSDSGGWPGETGGGSVVTGFQERLHARIPALPSGTAVLVQAPGGTLLFDTGSREAGRHVVQLLDEHEVGAIDHLVVHPGARQSGGCTVVLGSRPVSAVYHAGISERGASWRQCLDAVEDGVVVTPPGLGVGTPLRLDSTTYATVLYVNNTTGSLVLRIDYGASSLLLSGPLPCDQKKEILASGVDVRVDVVQVTSDASCGAWLDATQAREAFVQGPGIEGLEERLQAHGIQLRSAETMDVAYWSDGSTWSTA